MRGNKIGCWLALVALIATSSSASWSGGILTRATERADMQPVGLRRIQRRPELVNPRDELAQDSSEEQADILARVAAVLAPQQSYDQSYQKRSPISHEDGSSSVSQGAPQVQHEFIYVIAPVSEQALPFEQAKFDLGYRQLVSLGHPNYRTGLQKTSPPNQLDANVANSCQAKRTRVRLARDELEPATGRLVRQCAGLVDLNTCDGQCASSVQPSVMSPGGFLKKCACCNEGAFRRIQVRLDECRPAEGGAEQQADFMDVEVDEPTECKCRPCDGLI